jgi:hypothetical protein
VQATIPAAAGNKPVTARPELTVREPPQTTDSLNTTSEHAGQRISMRARNVLLFGTHKSHQCQEGVRTWPGDYAQPSAARISLPGARCGRSPPRCVELAFRTPPRHRAPGPGTWKDPDPRRRSSRGSEGPEQACLPGKGGYATPAGCPVSTTSRRYDLRRTCRLVTAGHIDLDPHSQTRPRYRSPQSGTAINGHVVFGSSNFRSPNRDAWLPWLSPLVSARRSFVYGRL